MEPGPSRWLQSSVWRAPTPTCNHEASRGALEHLAIAHVLLPNLPVSACLNSMTLKWFRARKLTCAIALMDMP
eukprot:2271772-Amphidinium_carterae.2